LDLQIALAIAEGFDHIVLSGCGLIDVGHKGTAKDATTLQWLALHRSTLWWVGFCAGRRINLTFEGPSVFAPLAGVYGREGFVKEAATVTING
jgi:hypothetical protein